MQINEQRDMLLQYKYDKLIPGCDLSILKKGQVEYY